MSGYVYTGDCRQILPTLRQGHYHACVTSPPYWAQRNYDDHPNQIGAEPDPRDYIANLVDVFAKVRRVLRGDGVLWLNLGDGYSTGTTAGRPPTSSTGIVGANRPEAQNSVARNGKPFGLEAKQLIGMPWRVALALQDDGWWLRQAIVWHKPNAMPSSATDRPTSDYEFVFLLAAQPDYFINMEAIAEVAASTPIGATGIPFGGKKQAGGQNRTYSGNEYVSDGTRNARSVWSINTEPSPEDHFAAMPVTLARKCIEASIAPYGVCSHCGAPIDYGPKRTCAHPRGSEPSRILDPFVGIGTTGIASVNAGCHFAGIELVSKYARIAQLRIQQAQPSLFQVSS